MNEGKGKWTREKLNARSAKKARRGGKIKNSRVEILKIFGKFLKSAEADQILTTDLKIYQNF